MSEATPTLSTSAATNPKFSMGRVVRALFVVGIVAGVSLTVPDMIAKNRSSKLHTRIKPLIREMGNFATYAEVKHVARVDPTRVKQLYGGRYQLDYVFLGLHGEYTVRIECWEFEDDPDWYLFSLQHFSARRL
jgi:hypothetical protein